VSETRFKPRIEFEDAFSPRLEPEPLVPPVSVAPGTGTLSLAAGGVAVLVAGFSVLQAANFIVGQFERGPILGGLTLLVAAGGFGLLATALWRELRGLFALRTVDRLRAALTHPDQARRAALAWLATLPEGEALAGAVRATEDPVAIAGLLRAGPLAALRARSDALGRAAAIQTFAVTAAVPSPALDGLLVAWRGTRLVREIAALHGMRPGTLGTLALLRRTALSAATVMTTDFATDAAARALLSNPLLAHVAGDVAGAGVAARRMIVLARAAAVACSPLPPA
jgi:uncharacterized membrane protein YcjF (UPF0283 family)